MLSPKEKYDAYVQDSINNGKMPLTFAGWKIERERRGEFEVVRFTLDVIGQNGFITFQVEGRTPEERREKAQQLFDKYLAQGGYETVEQADTRLLEKQLSREVKKARLYKHYDKRDSIKTTTDKYVPDMQRKTKTLLANISKMMVR